MRCPLCRRLTLGPLRRSVGRWPRSAEYGFHPRYHRLLLKTVSEHCAACQTRQAAVPRRPNLALPKAGILTKRSHRRGSQMGVGSIRTTCHCRMHFAPWHMPDSFPWPGTTHVHAQKRHCTYGYATNIVTTPRRLSLWHLTGIENATNGQPLGEASHAGDQSAGRTCVATYRYLRPATQLTWNDRFHCHGQNEASSKMVDVVEVTTSADAVHHGLLTYYLTGPDLPGSKVGTLAIYSILKGLVKTGQAVHSSLELRTNPPER